jgi:WhiB family transcriptional regulator, redox-sensing transcriptional regulator
VSTAERPDSWMELAECRGMDAELFMPARGDRDTVVQAKAVCVECPVRFTCLNHALDNNETHGIWGGKSERERRVMRRNRPKRNPSIPDAIAKAMTPGVTYNAENVRVLLGHKSHSAVTPALRTLIDEGRVECVRPYRNSFYPALYQLAGGAGPS